MVYAAGSYNGCATLARYTSAGALDTTFGGTGMVALDFAATPPPGGQTVFDVNSLVVTATGAAYAGLTAVFKLPAATTPASQASRRATWTPASASRGGLGEQAGHGQQPVPGPDCPDSRRVVTHARAQPVGLVPRPYTAAGAADTSFGTSGQAVGDLSDSYDYPAGMVQLSDGPILIGFSPDSGDGASMSGNLGLARHEASGKVDNLFGKPRWKWTTTSGTLASRAASFAMQADGKLLLAGVVENPGGNRDFAVMRLVKQPGW